MSDIVIRNASQVRLVADLERARQYYKEVLGFEVDEWGHAVRSNVVFLLEQAAHAEDIQPNKRPSRHILYPHQWKGPDRGRDTYAYLDWEALDLLDKEYKEKGAMYAAPIATTDEGFQWWREFVIKDLDGYVMVFCAGKAKDA